MFDPFQQQFIKIVVGQFRLFERVSGQAICILRMHIVNQGKSTLPYRLIYQGQGGKVGERGYNLLIKLANKNAIKYGKEAGTPLFKLTLYSEILE